MIEKTYFKNQQNCKVELPYQQTWSVTPERFGVGDFNNGTLQAPITQTKKSGVFAST